MITILSLKTHTGRATDAIDTVNTNVFSRLDSKHIKFIESQNFWQKIILIYKLKPDFLLGIGDVVDIFFVLLRPRSIRYLIVWHGLLRQTKTWPVRRYLFKQVAFVIAVSDCAGKTVQNFFPKKKVYTALNGVDFQFFNPNKKNTEYLAQKYGLSFDKPIVLFVGALFERKRPDVFISLAKKFKDANFVLIGRKDKIDFLWGTDGIANFKWIPNMGREDIAFMMASSDIFLFPSVNEPCAAVIPEAMASGLVPLLSKSCGNRELVDDGQNGFLIEVGEDEQAVFLSHLKNLLANSELRKNIALAARRKCEQELNWTATAQVYQGIFLKNL